MVSLRDWYRKFYLDQTSLQKQYLEDVMTNARKREYMAAALIDTIESLDDKNTHTVVAAGDLNAPWMEKCVTGKNVEEDIVPHNLVCASNKNLFSEYKDRIKSELSCEDANGDGFDDTHHLLMGGRSKSVSLTPLTDELGRRTYASLDFVDSPIDHIYAWGKGDFKDSKAYIPIEALNLEKVWMTQNEQKLSDGSEVDKLKIWGSDHFPVIVEIEL